MFLFRSQIRWSIGLSDHLTFPSPLSDNNYWCLKAFFASLPLSKCCIDLLCLCPFSHATLFLLHATTVRLISFENRNYKTSVYNIFCFGRLSCVKIRKYLADPMIRSHLVSLSTRKSANFASSLGFKVMMTGLHKN